MKQNLSVALLEDENLTSLDKLKIILEAVKNDDKTQLMCNYPIYSQALHNIISKKNVDPFVRYILKRVTNSLYRITSRAPDTWLSSEEEKSIEFFLSNVIFYLEQKEEIEEFIESVKDESDIDV